MLGYNSWKHITIPKSYDIHYFDQVSVESSDIPRKEFAMEPANRKALFLTSAIGILYLVFLYVALKYLWKDGYISLQEITGSTLLKRFTQDSITALLFPLLLLFIYRRKPSSLGLIKKNVALCIILFIIYLAFFILRSDYTVSGIYRAVFYLIMVGASEEIIMRGYIYLRIKSVNKIAAVIISGILFGSAHAILPGIIEGDSLSFIGINMLNEIGGGIVGGLLFIACMELSGTILVAILIHSLLDSNWTTQKTQRLIWHAKKQEL
jgi:membrane protease YdiL (CAAX protease family)